MHSGKEKRENNFSPGITVPRKPVLKEEPTTGVTSLFKSASSWFGYSNNEKESRESGFDKVVWCNFDKLELGNEKINVLVICYTNGFQIWDIDEKKNFREIYSKRDAQDFRGMVFLKLLPTPIHPHLDIFANDRPLALIYFEYGELIPKPSPQTKPTKLYSLAKDSFLTIYKKDHLCDVKLYNIATSREFSLMVTESFIIGLDSHKFSKLFKMKTFNVPPAVRGGVFAIHSHWLAVPSDVKSLSPEEEKIFQDNETIYLAARATEIGAAIYEIGAEYFKYIYNNIGNPSSPSTANAADHRDKSSDPKINNNNAPPAANNKNEKEQQQEGGGIVALYNLNIPSDNKQILLFRSHRQPIACLEFDPSGSLLATASVDGMDVNIYQIVVNNHLFDSSPHNFERKSVYPQLLYKLFRGHSAASIRSIKFSTDSKFVGVLSSKVTTHVFAINPCGGPVTSKTHPLPFSSVDTPDLPSPSLNLPDDENDEDFVDLPANGKNDTNKVLQYEVVGRVHKYSVSDDQSPFDGAIIFNSSNSFLSIQSAGITLSYSISSKEKKPDQDPTKLFVDISNDFSWDTPRKLASKEVLSDLSLVLSDRKRRVPKKRIDIDSYSRWVNEIEIQSFDSARALCNNPLFHFKRVSVSSDQSDPNNPRKSFDEKTLFQSIFPSSPITSTDLNNNNIHNTFSSPSFTSHSPVNNFINSNNNNFNNNNIPNNNFPNNNNNIININNNPTLIHPQLPVISESLSNYDPSEINKLPLPPSPVFNNFVYPNTPTPITPANTPNNTPNAPINTPINGPHNTPINTPNTPNTPINAPRNIPITPVTPINPNNNPVHNYPVNPVVGNVHTPVNNINSGRQNIQNNNINNNINSNNVNHHNNINSNNIRANNIPAPNNPVNNTPVNNINRHNPFPANNININNNIRINNNDEDEEDFTDFTKKLSDSSANFNSPALGEVNVPVRRVGGGGVVPSPSHAANQISPFDALRMQSNNKIEQLNREIDQVRRNFDPPSHDTPPLNDEDDDLQFGDD